MHIYQSSRRSVLELLPAAGGLALDVGCSTGEMAHHARDMRPEWSFHGVELDRSAAVAARRWMAEVFEDDVEDLNWQQLETRYHAVVFADVLEHLRDPWLTLRQAVDHALVGGGRVIVSIPNIRHVSSLWSVVVGGVWPYRDRGIHDRTHLRYFTLKNIEYLLDQAGLDAGEVTRSIRFTDRLGRVNATLSRLGLDRVVGAIPGVREFFTYQYVVACSPRTQEP